jgi:hypothetical protein
MQCITSKSTDRLHSIRVNVLNCSILVLHYLILYMPVNATNTAIYNCRSIPMQNCSATEVNILYFIKTHTQTLQLALILVAWAQKMEKVVKRRILKLHVAMRVSIDNNTERDTFSNNVLRAANAQLKDNNIGVYLK